jgi:hypothetical protein
MVAAPDEKELTPFLVLSSSKKELTPFPPLVLSSSKKELTPFPPRDDDRIRPASPDREQM